MQLIDNDVQHCYLKILQIVTIIDLLFVHDASSAPKTCADLKCPKGKHCAPFSDGPVCEDGLLLVAPMNDELTFPAFCTSREKCARTVQVVLFGIVITFVQTYLVGTTAAAVIVPTRRN